MIQLKQNLIEISDEVFIPIYKRFPVIFDHGDGIYLYDTDGKEYLDFASGIGVMALGYNNTKYNEALKVQIDKLLHAECGILKNLNRQKCRILHFCRLICTMSLFYIDITAKLY